jgi:polysaccharide biosynthesis/export protein
MKIRTAELVRIGVALAIAGLLAPDGMASAGQNPQPPQAPVNVEPAVPGEGAPEYLLQLGDVLEVRHFFSPELNVSLPIRPDGRISLELVGEIQAAGVTPAQLRQTLLARYAEWLAKPELTVMVKEFAGAKVFVGGEVVAPGIVRTPGNLTLVQAVLQAGGFKHTAELKNVVILRNQGTSEPLFLMFDLAARLKGKTTTPDILLASNDIVFVPKTKITKMNEFVDQYFRQITPIPVSLGLSYVFGAFFP